MLPISLRADGRRALIVGGGNVAFRKAAALLEAGFALTVIAPSIDARLRALLDRPDALLHERAYASGDVLGCDVVVAATDHPEINAAVVGDARAARILVSDAANSDDGDFTMQTTVRIGELTFAIDSGRSSPAFAQRIARELRERFGAEYDAAARTLARMRVYVRTVLEPPQRGAVMRELADLPVDELARMNPAQAEHVVEETIERIRHPEAHAEGVPRRAAVTCASRGSALAMTQARLVAAALAQRGIATTIETVSTTGDREQDRPVSELGSINVWVKELEVALLEGRADYAVHSCKDLPGELDLRMQLTAISAREDARDAFCSERYASFEALPPGAVVGTSSERRRAQLRALRPDLRYESLRGNVDTRLRKLREGQYDAIVLAMAGLRRLGIAATHTVPFDPQRVVPAVGQGALAIETLANDEQLSAELRAAVNHEPTQWCIEAERAVLRVLRAGCSAPLGVHAQLVGAMMSIDAAFAVAGGTMLREHVAGGVDSPEASRKLGEQLAVALAAARDRLAHPRVLLPRTQDRPSRIAAELRGRGVEVVELREGESGPELMNDIPQMLLFPSSGSVAAVRPYLDWLRAQSVRPLVAAMGPQSGAAASAAGFAPDILAPDASIDAFVTAVAQRLEAR
ncbi:MAG TPA: hydroxymethylbilane synthase [Candidatus Acidoferrum sp.]|jgi:hydroxymethylbilane synthase|nr:hydroxymethylbilane synthase [Candidatus Acidoferrum sp.]